MKKITYIIIGALMSMHVAAQPLIIDRVVGVVGDFNVLQSDIEQQYLQMKMSGMYMDPDARCQIFNQFVEQKLLMAQAKIDSVEVGPDMVEMRWKPDSTILLPSLVRRRRWKIILINRSTTSRMTSVKPSENK